MKIAKVKVKTNLPKHNKGDIIIVEKVDWDDELLDVIDSANDMVLLKDVDIISEYTLASV